MQNSVASTSNRDPEAPGAAPVENDREHLVAASSSRWRRRAWAGLLLVGIFAIGHFAGAAQKEQELLKAQEIQAERFELRGADNVLRASLSRGPKGETYLSFFGKDGKPGLSLGLNGDGTPAISLYDRQSKTRIGLSVDPEGGNPQLVLFDDDSEPAIRLGIPKGSGPDITVGRKGKGGVSISLTKDGDPSIRVRDQGGDSRLSLGLSGGEPSISLFGPKNVLRSSWRANADGSVAFSLYDGKALRRLAIELDRDGKPAIRFLDPTVGAVRVVQ